MTHILTHTFEDTKRAHLNKHSHKRARLSYHYEFILRDDLILKLCHSNIMTVPKLLQITLLAKVPYEWIKQNELALDILCAQKSVVFESVSSYQTHTHTNNYYLRVSLRKQHAYNCVEKLATVKRTLYEVNLNKNVIEFTLKSSVARFFPEILNHFDLHMYMSCDLQLTLETSAQNEEQTRLFWTGYTHANYGVHLGVGHN